MAGPVFSDAQVEIHLDGGTLPGEAAAAGALAGEAFSAAFNRELGNIARKASAGFNDIGKKSGVNFASGFKTASARIVADFRGVLDRMANLPVGQNRFVDGLFDSLNRLEGLGKRVISPIASSFDDVRNRASFAVRSVREFANNNPILQQMATNAQRVGGSFRYIFDRVKEVSAPFGQLFNRMREASGNSDGLTKSLNKQGSAWSKLSPNTRQWTLIIGAVAASMGQLAPLASAAAAGLVILGGAFAAVVLGAGVAIAAFQGLTGEISALPEAVQPAAAAFQSIGDAFGKMQEAIQIAALSNAAPAFDSLRATVEGLIPAFETVGVVVGQVISSFAASIAPGTAGFANFDAIIRGLAPVFLSISNAAIIAGEAFGNIFVIALPYVQQFGVWLETIAAQFLAFTQTNPGVIDQWFANGVVILSAFGDLLGAVGTALAELVTPDTVAMTVAFLDSLTGFVPALTGILAVLGELNIFGLLAGLLDALGPAILVLVPPLMEVASVISGVLMQAFTSLAPIITDLAAAFAPVISIIAQLISTILPPLLAILMPIIEAVAGFAIQLLGALMPALQALLPAFAGLLAALEPVGVFIASLIEQLLPALLPIIEMLVPVFAQVIAAIAPLVTAILPPLMALIQALVPVVLLIVDAFIQLLAPILELITPLLELIQTIIPPLAELIGVVLAFAVDGLMKAFQFLVPIIQGVVSMLVGILKPAIEGITQVLGGVIDFLIGVFTGDWERAWSGIVGIFEGIWNGIVGIAEGVINGIIDLINGLIGAVNAVGGAVGISIGEVGHVYFAKGGLVTGRTNAILGEAGPEMVIPLSRPLGTVDPAVRDVAAYARGEGGSGGPERIVTVEEGAFTFIVPNEQAARLVANSVLDNLVAATDL